MKWTVSAAVLCAGIVGALAVTAVAQTQRFPDVPPDHYAYEAVEWAADTGLTVGYGDGTFRPEEPLGRWHAVTFVQRYYDKILQADRSPGFTRADMMVLLKTIDDSRFPGQGVDVTAGRANWTSGYFQAELYKLLLEELGYDVSDPADLEIGPGIAYLAMAEGGMDYWPNSWYPAHRAWLAAEMHDGSPVGDHVTAVGRQMIGGGLQGFLVTKSFADTYGVHTMDDLNRNARALAAFDATDPRPGNGKADIFGCPRYRTCDDVITNMIAFSGWDNIRQITQDYDAMIGQAADRADRGVPMVAYAWTPSAYITDLRPGDNVYWMGVDDILDDSNPANLPGGAGHDQRGADGTGGFAPVGRDKCPSAADQPSRLCKIGWITNDIRVTARNQFLDANPAARRLFEVVELPVPDVSLAALKLQQGAEVADLAAQWIADNRSRVDGWIAAALAAAQNQDAR